ncbi:hypothetical protein EC991_010993, partial [Linnemannia zychae]
HKRCTTEVRRRTPSSSSAWQKRNPAIYDPGSHKPGNTPSEANRAGRQTSIQPAETLNHSKFKSQDWKEEYQKLLDYNRNLQCEFKLEEIWKCNALGHIQQLENASTKALEYSKQLEQTITNLSGRIRQLEHDKANASGRIQQLERDNANASGCVRQLQHDKATLTQKHDELERKFINKVKSYKSLNKTYMDLVRPLHVSSNDYSTIYSRVMRVRVLIENLIQKAKGVGSVNLNGQAALEIFQQYFLPDDIPPDEVFLPPYYANLFMESAIMATLIYRIFYRGLGCVFDQSEVFNDIVRWVDKRDNKIAVRWRQQLCLLLTQDSEAMQSRREREVDEVVKALSDMLSRVYLNVDMSARIKELCYTAFDLSFAMYGMDSIIHPIITPLGTPFDDTAMLTPQKSNPTGTVSLLIFPAFTDNGTFYVRPKVWCADE